MAALPRPFVSIIVPCRNEERYIRRCLDSIVATDYPLDRLEVLIVDGRSDDGTREILAQYTSQHPWMRTLDNPKQITPAALNIGIRGASGELIMRMDAHAFYPPSYVSQLVTALQDTGAAAVGGRLVTLPADDSPVARAIAIAMAHPFGVGNSYFRIGVKTQRSVDHVPFFCCRKEAFARAGLFDEELVRHQDGDFSARLIKQGGRILLLPGVVAYYFARRSFRQAARMFHQYGYFKPLVARKLGRIMTARQLAPPALLLSLTTTGLLSAWVPAAGLLFGGILTAYAAAVVGCSAAVARKHGAACGLVIAALFPVLHVSYGLGFLRRVFELATGAARRPGSSPALPLSR